MKSAIAVLILAVSSFAQPAGQLSLAGSVVNSMTGTPIAHADVTINWFIDPDDAAPPIPSGTAQQRLNRTAFTDSGGYFRFTGLPKGDYTVMARKPEFVWDASTESAAAGPLRLGASVENYVAKLSPLGVITGTVVDQDGLPLPGARVIALSVRIQDGVQQIRSDRNMTTDDRGIYRLWNLAPGKYFLKTESGSTGSFEFIGNTPASPDESFQMVYFGGAHSLDSANPIEIGAGTEVHADFAVTIEQAYRVAGSVANFVARRPLTVELVSGAQDVATSRVGVNAETGKFVIGTVAPGSYVLRATQDTATAEAPLTVKSSDVDGISITLSPQVEVPVVTRFTNSAKPVDQEVERFVPDANCMPFLRPVGKPGNILYGRVRGPGLENLVAGVSPGIYTVTVQCVGGYARSANAGSQDLGSNPALTILPGISPAPIEIVATHGGGSIKGKVDVAGMKQITILLVPQFANPAGPMVAQTFADEMNANVTEFGFQDLAPGAYTAWAFANPDIEFRNPEFLRKLSGGTIVQIDGDGEKEVTITEVVR